MIDHNAIVPIPNGTNHPKKDGRVFPTIQKNYDPDKRYNINRRLVIGRSIDDERMHPNDACIAIYPETYAEHAPHAMPMQHVTKTIGPFAACPPPAKGVEEQEAKEEKEEEEERSWTGKNEGVQKQAEGRKGGSHARREKE